MNERVIFLEKDDEVTAIISALKRTKADRVVFVLPIRSVLFQSIVSVKILRARAEDLGKWIFAVTKDKKGRNLLETVGVPAFETLEEYEATSIEKIFPKTQKSADPKVISRHTFNADKLIRKTIDKQKKPENKQTTEAKESKINWREVLLKPSKKSLIALAALAMSLFFFVSWLVLPYATVAIKPNKNTKMVTDNVVLTPDLAASSTTGRQKVIRAYPVKETYTDSITFQTESKIFEGENASGEIVIVNTDATSKTLRATTRFQSKNGVVYRIANWARIPAASSDQNGELSVNVTADTEDSSGQIVGERGNLEAGQKLFIPGFHPEGTDWSQVEQDPIWAEVREPITGGVTDWKPVVRQEDLDKARQAIEEKLTAEALTRLERTIQEQNQENNTDLRLIPDHSKFVTKNVSNIQLPPNILETNEPSFQVTAEITVTSWSYSESELKKVINEALIKKKEPDREIEGITNYDLEIVDDPAITSGLKVTYTAEGIEAYNIKPNTDEGLMLINRIKTQIANKNASEAENILTNSTEFPEISEAEIIIWPPFINSIPRLKENILVEIE
jgi:hypothetical protein